MLEAGWSPPDNEELGGGSLPPEMIMMIMEQGIHGIVISGVIAWIKNNRNESAKNIWRRIAEQHWSEKEVTLARRALITAAGLDKVTGLVPNLPTYRTTPSKMQREVKDIIDIITKLEDLKEMPVVLASSDQIAWCPSARGSIDTKNTDTAEGVISRMMSMEETMSTFMNTLESSWRA